MRGFGASWMPAEAKRENVPWIVWDRCKGGAKREYSALSRKMTANCKRTKENHICNIKISVYIII